MKSHIKLAVCTLAVVTIIAGCKCPPARVVPTLSYSARTATNGLTVAVFPDSQAIEVGQPATFIAEVAGYGTNDYTLLSYEWQLNKAPYASDSGTNVDLTWKDLNLGACTNWTPVVGSPTNSGVFIIASVTTNDAAYYRVKVTAPGPTTIISDPVLFNSFYKTHSIVPQSAVTSVTGNGGGCPGAYKTRIDYSWYWPIAAGAALAKDQQSSSTWVKWYDWNNHSGCGTGSVSFTANPSLPYTFSIYSTSTNITTPYNLYLQDF